MKLLTNLCCLALLLSSVTTHAQSPASIKVEALPTESGVISGITSSDKSVMIFKGIPYAAPPLGSLRWKEPQPFPHWAGIKKCDHFGPSAMQGKPNPFSVYTREFLIPASGPISEDCLFLNVWTAARSTNEKRPVIVFIHGGAFIAGGGACDIYDGESMAKKGVIFVTINYRLGVFGFFAHPELTTESAHHASGNYGIMDQIAALQWVKNNIAAFGGDPDNVTIAGQSAGAMSVNTLDASPLAKGLFAKMIAESGGLVKKGFFGGYMPLDTAEARGLQLQESAGASDLKSLREIPADQLMAAFKGIGIVIVDGYVLPESVPAIFAAHRQTPVPLLTGYNNDDVIVKDRGSLSSFQETLARFGPDSLKVLAMYPAANDEQARFASKDLERDMGFGLQNYGWSVLHSSVQPNTYMYFFARHCPMDPVGKRYSAYHTAEVPYAYDNLRFIHRPLMQGRVDRSLAKLMSSYWVNFARTGDPNGPDLPVWPRFTEDKAEVMILDGKSAAQRLPSADGLRYLYSRSPN